MHIPVQLLVSISLTAAVAAQSQYPTTESFIQMVLSNLTASQKYELPLDNSKLYTVTDEYYHYDCGNYDFIIVGAGSAGSLLANRLSAVSHWNILLLEAGGQENDFSDIPGMAGALVFSDMNWGYNSIPQKNYGFSMINREIAASRGKVLGGSSVINAKMFVRGNKLDFDLWAKMGNFGWSYDEVLPSFINYENYGPSNGDEGYHGYAGPLHVNFSEPTPYTRLYVDGMKELGYPEVDYNGRNQIGVSQIVSSINGRKISSGGRAFIDPILDKRRNLHLSLNSFVTKVILDPLTKRAHAVIFVKNGKRYIARCTKEIILSAGAFNSPQILMLSGIGPTRELNKIGKHPIIPLPVGQNLQDHPVFFGLILRTNTTLFNESLSTSITNYLNNKRPLTAAYNVDSLSFFNVNNKYSSVPDIQTITVVPPGLSQNPGRFLHLNEQGHKDFDNNYNIYTDFIIFVILLHPKSRGAVTLKSQDPCDFPNIDYNFFSDPDEEDFETLYKGILHTLKLTETDAFKSVNATFISVIEECNNLDLKSKEYWNCAIRHFTQTIYHPVGTTRMGIAPINSVVNPRLKVHGTLGLRVVDAGVMPEITSGNTNAPTYMIAQRISELIKVEYNELYNI